MGNRLHLSKSAMIFSRHLSDYEAIFQTKYKLSSTIRHKGERGRQREHGLREFLEENLPAAYGVATGEIIVAKSGEVSPQCDVIVYDRLRIPILGSKTAVQQIPIEGVYAVIESKSILDARALKDAKEKFAAITELPRTPSVTVGNLGKRPWPEFVLVGYQMRTTAEACIQFMKPHTVRCNVAVVALHHGMGAFITRPSPAEPLVVWLDGSKKRNRRPLTLAMWFLSFLDDLNRIELGTPRFIDWLE